MLVSRRGPESETPAWGFGSGAAGDGLGRSAGRTRIVGQGRLELVRDEPLHLVEARIARERLAQAAQEFEVERMHPADDPGPEVPVGERGHVPLDPRDTRPKPSAPIAEAELPPFEFGAFDRL